MTAIETIDSPLDLTTEQAVASLTFLGAECRRVLADRPLDEVNRALFPRVAAGLDWAVAILAEEPEHPGAFAILALAFEGAPAAYEEHLAELAETAAEQMTDEEVDAL